MTRGTKRGRRIDSASGAAAAGTPPTREAAAPGPPKKRKAGRKAAAPLAKVGNLIEKLELGHQKRELLAIAELARTLAKSNCGARDAAAALSVEARCRNKLIDLLHGDDQDAEIRDLKAQVAAMNAHLAGKKGSAQRADVAPAPRAARRAESLQ